MLVLGANGPSGRRTVQQALGRGLRVDALTRRPQGFPTRHERLHVVGGDATDPGVVDAAVAACDAVISVIGAPFTRHPVDVYSTSARLVVSAMQRHGQRRLLTVTSTGLTPVDQRHDIPVLERLLAPLARRTFGRSVYDDMERMESVVSGSDLDWTIVRPPGLTDEPGTGYQSAENWVDGGYCARDDLATLLLDQLDDTRYLRKVVAVSTPGLQVRTWQTIRRELLKR
ncbi:Putative NADH-flavin reductase [Auraticoccus monumenti]|uniref:Putative NADH-flavin reductase n=1 Tax=Auraticoccus monumenti TaxID=675864 RepID=A0A1G6Z345_9ACTN|nr:Putative NADH-flavin reductase [Auraticoccus monumenti]